MYKVNRQRPGIYYAEIMEFSFEQLVKLRQDLVVLSNYYDECKDIVIWKFSYKLSFSESIATIPSIKDFLQENPLDYDHTVIIVNNPALAPIIKWFHDFFPKILGDVSFAADLEEAVQEALQVQNKKPPRTE